MSAKALEFEGAKMVVSAAAAMMISSSTSTRIHQCTMQSKICLSTSLHGMVRVFDVKPNKSSPLYKGVHVNGDSQGGVKINGSSTHNNNNVGMNDDFVEEENRKHLSPDWMGRYVEDSMVFRQSFAIRSNEVGPDKTASIETLINHLQETVLNSVWLSGPVGDGFTCTHEMSRRNLIWVAVYNQVQVESYPSCLWTVMNTKTRKLSKIPNEVREELQPYFNDKKIIEEEVTQKSNKFEDSTPPYVRSDLTPHWSDLDANQHVNNIKYISWIFESMPISILQNNEIANITLEYKRECMLSHTLQSLSSPQGCNKMDSI
ncbi:palmitoyl-acyl carrier protein thioesterase, chloroplastic isoform X2 [Cryptomeria japonica]|uniref:palmitoyl-acyl carrier protein thioesterase, chloroplastic isoform X2 n=1 Tax=Cryptomeria japonica TaxID=3369 RepID=UPI0027DA78B3|nr:palmitoyl-acyl carrier protein thioesterase, chloroplastic isoform X2 [Cryptomeria japonica]